MNPSLLLRTNIVTVAAVLAMVMVLCAWIGHWFGQRRKGKTDEGEERGLGTMEGALLAVFGLLLAFSFSMAGDRFELRRELLVQEANAIGTAILRADLYAEPERAAFRQDFQRYLDVRIEFYNAGADRAKIRDALARGGRIQSALWARAASLSRDPTNFVASTQMVPALNAMFDAGSSRLAALRTRVPESITWLLFGLAAACSCMIGYGAGLAAKFDWIGAIGFSLLTVAVIFVTLDLDRPRRGLIRLDTSEESILDLREMFSADQNSAKPQPP
jgi:hypothetical protein